MAWVEILPRFASLFRNRSWESAASFLDWTGILVNKHRKRQVEQVTFEPDAPARDGMTLAGASGSPTFYLKKEFGVSWHDRFRNAWHGFGWCATAVREAAILQALRAAGIGCPEVAALGEDGRRAFVLMRDESDMLELRSMLPMLSNVERNQLADALGRELAKMHEVGFDHPDLFSKHILTAADGATFRFCILDWQRSRRRKAVSWRLRCRDLAALDATMHDALASDRLRVRCLRAYLRSTQLEGPPLGRIARQIRREAKGLLEQRNIREVGQLATPPKDQQFVPCGGGRLLVVRSFYEKSGSGVPEWLTRLDESDLRSASSFANASGSEIVTCSATATREIPTLAHTLFRLERFGVSAPRLLAVSFLSAHVILLVQRLTSVPLVEAFAKADSLQRARLLRQAGGIVRQLHEAGYQLPLGDSWERRLGIGASGEIVLTKVETLLRGDTRWQELAPVEFNRQKMRLSRTEQLRFLQGYLKQQRGNLRQMLSLPGLQAW